MSEVAAERALVASVESLLIATAARRDGAQVTQLLAEGSAEEYAVLAAGLLEAGLPHIRASVLVSAANMLGLHAGDADLAAAEWTARADARYGPAWRP